MASTYTPYFKLFNGTDWDTYYFKTLAGQVSVSSTRKFLTASVRVNGNTAGTTGAKVTVDSGTGDGANIEIDGAHIIGKATPVSGESLETIAQSDSVAVALGKLDHEIEVAKGLIPAGVVTVTNFADSLDTVFSTTGNDAYSMLGSIIGLGNDGGVIKHDGEFYLSTDLGAIANLGQNSTGFLKKTGNGIWALDATTYVPQTRKINGSALSSDLNFYATNLYMSNASGAQSISEAIIALQAKMTAATQAFSIKVTTTSPSYTVPNGYLNDQFKKFDDNVILDPRNNNKLLGTNGEDILLSSLEVGDDLYIENADYPDRWVSSKSSNAITFVKRIEARQTWDSITNKPNTLAYYGDNLKIANGVIYINGVSITPLTSHQTMLYRPIGVGGTQKLGNTSATMLNFVAGTGITITENNGSFTFSATQDGDTKDHVGSTNKVTTKMFLIGATAQQSDIQSFSNVNCYIGTDNCLYSNGKKTNTMTVTTGSTTPSNPSTGDLWFDTTA